MNQIACATDECIEEDDQDDIGLDGAQSFIQEQKQKMEAAKLSNTTRPDPSASEDKVKQIRKEAEEKSAPPKKEGGAPKRNGRTMFAPGEMGAADWAESMEALEQPTFSNRPLVIDRRSK